MCAIFFCTAGQLLFLDVLVGMDGTHLLLDDVDCSPLPNRGEGCHKSCAHRGEGPMHAPRAITRVEAGWFSCSSPHGCCDALNSLLCCLLGLCQSKQRRFCAWGLHARASFFVCVLFWFLRETVLAAGTGSSVPGRISFPAGNATKSCGSPGENKGTLPQQVAAKGLQ